MRGMWKEIEGLEGLDFVLGFELLQFIDEAMKIAGDVDDDWWLIVEQSFESFGMESGAWGIDNDGVGILGRPIKSFCWSGAPAGFARNSV